MKKQKQTSFFVIFIISVIVTGFYQISIKGEIMSMRIISDAFSQGGNIPVIFTCNGKNISPPLSWSGAPEKTKSFTLICDDPDASSGVWDHWILFNIPASVKHLPQNMTAMDNLSDGTRHGKNTWGRNDYGGPCPPSGRHRYYFKIYALDTLLNLPSGARKSDIEHAMRSHILAQGELMGYYSK